MSVQIITLSRFFCELRCRGKDSPMCSSHKRALQSWSCAPKTLAVGEILTQPMRGRSPCSQLPGSSPTSKGRDKESWDHIKTKTSGLDMPVPMVDKHESQWLCNAHKWKSPQTTSACAPRTNVRTVLPTQSTKAYASRPWNGTPLPIVVKWEESSRVTKVPLAESRRLLVMESSS